MPEISVILPVYNAENTIAAAIESIPGQTFKDFEFLIVDNNSTDNSRKIIEAYRARDNRIRLLHETRQGVMYAANNAVRKAEGHYAARVDADDISFPDRLEKHYSYLETHRECDVVSCFVELGGCMESNNGFRRYIDWINSVQTYDEILLNRFIESPVVNPSVLMRKSVFDRIGLFEEGDFPEDYEFWLRALDQGIRIEKIPEVLMQWNDSPTRLTRTDDRYSSDAFYRAKTAYLKKYLGKRGLDKEGIYIWGAGRVSRKKAALLEKAGVKIDAFIDIVRRDTVKYRCLYYEDVDYSEKKFILSYVGTSGAGEKIRGFLSEQAYREGDDFLIVA